MKVKWRDILYHIIVNTTFKVQCSKINTEYKKRTLSKVRENFDKLLDDKSVIIKENICPMFQNSVSLKKTLKLNELINYCTLKVHEM